MTEEVGQTAEEPKVETKTESPKNDYVLSGEELTKEETPKEKPAEEAAKEKPKQKNGFKKKIARLEAEIERLSKTQSGQSLPEVKKPEPESVKPTPDKYPDYNEYLEALADYKAEAKVNDVLKKRDNEAKESKARETLETKRLAFEDQKEVLRESKPDLDEVFEAYNDKNITNALGAAILDSDEAVAVAYELAKDPKEFDRLNSNTIGIIAINKAIAKIEARLEKSEIVPKAAVTTKAPPPITPVKKSSSSNTGYSEDDSFETYKAKRASGKI